MHKYMSTNAFHIENVFYDILYKIKCDFREAC